jgi:hypothetical protein
MNMAQAEQSGEGVALSELSAPRHDGVRLVRSCPLLQIPADISRIVNVLVESPSRPTPIVMIRFALRISSIKGSMLFLSSLSKTSPSPAVIFLITLNNP